MKFRSLAFVPLLAFSSASPAAEQLPVSSYCACLSAVPPDADGKRDGGVGFSIVLPATARNLGSGAGESGWNTAWAVGKARVFAHYGVTFHGNSFSEPPPRRQCTFEIRHRQIIVDERSGARIEIVGHVKDDTPRDRNHWLWIAFSAADRSTACSLGSTALRNLIFINDWKQWVLVSISRNRKSFRYRNEIGEVREAKLGDYITRDDGKVTSITKDSVVFTELMSDGSGGWVEQGHALRLGGQAASDSRRRAR